MVFDIVILCPVSGSHTLFQVNCVINLRVLLQDLHHALIRCLILLLVYAVLYVNTFTPSFILTTECFHLSPNTCKPLFMFLHLIFCCPSSHCIPHAIFNCQMTILIRYFTCLVAQLWEIMLFIGKPKGRSMMISTAFSTWKTARFVRWHHFLPTFGCEIALSAGM